MHVAALLVSRHRARACMCAVWVIPHLEELPGIMGRLEDHPHPEQQVHRQHPIHKSPDSRVGAVHGSGGPLDDGVPCTPS